MSNQSQRERYKKTDEEFMGEGAAESKKAKESESNRRNYKEWTFEDLRREAQRKNVKKYMEMDREELINRLQSQP